MNKLILLLTTSLIFSQQLKVDGNLKVEGNIDASGNPITNIGTPQAVTDALNLQTLNNMMTDDGVYEYKTVVLRIYPEDLFTDDPPEQYRRYKDLESTNYINSNFDDYITSLSSQGYQLYQISPPVIYSSTYYMFLYTFKRPLEQD